MNPSAPLGAIPGATGHASPGSQANAPADAAVRTRRVPSSLKDVTLHLVDIPGSAEDLADLKALLSREELARADRFVSPDERRRFLVTRATLRRLLGAAVGVPPQHLCFDATALGKPLLPHFPDLHFSVSHAGAFALIGMTPAAPLGVDIERERVDFDAMGIARARFSEAEVAALLRLPAGSLRPAFYRLWTAKEALTKATGVGIGTENPVLPPALWPALMAQAAALQSPLAIAGRLLAPLPAPGGYAAAAALLQHRPESRPDSGVTSRSARTLSRMGS